MKVVKCGSCGAPMTVPLDVIDAAQIDLTVAGDATLPRGSIVLWAPARTVERWTRGGSGSEPVVQAPEGSVVVHPDDRLAEALKPVGQASGCCGLDGQDGLNQGCVCGAVLGTAWNDCWTANDVRFLPDAVLIIDAG